MNQLLIERIYKRILNESNVIDTTGLACYVSSITGNEIEAAVYDMNGMREDLTNNPEIFTKKSLQGKSAKSLIKNMVGCVAIKPTDDPCWGAYEISYIVGPGKIVYGLAYALSPNGMLISDRYAMSQSALKAWKNMSDKQTRGKRPLDNVRSPKTPGPEDDCEFRKEEYLNYAYESEGWEKGMLNGLRRAHENFVQNEVSISKKDFEEFIYLAGITLFDLS